MKKALKFISVALTASVAVSSVSFCVYAKEENEEKVRIIVENNTYSASDGASWDGILVDKWVDIDENSSIISALIDVLNTEGYTQTGAENGYITEIGGLAAYDDGGYMSGWMASLNDWFTDEGLSAYTVESGKLEDGDEICFQYTLDWGADLSYYWNKNETNLSGIEFSAGKLKPEFDVNVTEYTLILPEETSSIKVVPTAANKIFRVKTYKNVYTPQQDGTDYKRTEEITINDGDVLYIGVGNSAWHLYPPEGSMETVYKINISVKKSEHDINTEDSEKAQKVIKFISQIGTVSVNSKGLIDTAREAYNSLTTEQKALVTNYDILVQAEKAYSSLLDIQATFNEMFNKSTDYMMSIISPKIGNEWKITALARADKISDEFKTEYYNNAVEYIKSIGSSKLSTTKSTDNSKIIITLSSLGFNAENIGGYNLVEPLFDIDYVTKQGINGAIYALIALDTMDYNAPDLTRKSLIDNILSSQLKDGGWTFFGDKSDSDVTSMAIQSLSPYYKDNEKVKTAVNNALTFLSKNQNSDGTFNSYGASDCESTSQAIIAFTETGINISSDSRFIKNENTTVDGLERFYIDGMFAHSQGGKYNDISTEQAYCALVSYNRYLNGKSSFYDMTDIIPAEIPSENSDEQNSQINQISQNNQSSIKPETSNENTALPNTGDSQKPIFVFVIICISSVISMFYGKKYANK